MKRPSNKPLATYQGQVTVTAGDHGSCTTRL